MGHIAVLNQDLWVWPTPHSPNQLRIKKNTGKRLNSRERPSNPCAHGSRNHSSIKRREDWKDNGREGKPWLPKLGTVGTWRGFQDGLTDHSFQMTRPDPTRLAISAQMPRLPTLDVLLLPPGLVAHQTKHAWIPKPHFPLTGHLKYILLRHDVVVVEWTGGLWFPVQAKLPSN